MKLARGRIVKPTTSIESALRKMDELDTKLLLVLEENDKFIGLLSIGDIQRAIIRDESLNNSVKSILRANFRVGTPEDSKEDIERLMLDFRMEYCPIVDKNGNILDILFWEDSYGNNQISPKFEFKLPVVIMAGGYGTRLQPLTNVLPKPLLPIGDKTMLEHIFERFSKYGCNQFHISVNYKADLIEYYIRQQNLDQFEFNFFNEDKPLGTAGSLSLIKEHLNETFFVTNCDILIEQDYSEVLDYHRTHNNELTIVAAFKKYDIPYGTVTTGNEGQLLELNEKPSHNYKINSGMYVLEPHLLKDIPEGEFFHITYLIDRIISKGGRVGVFPVSENSWTDMGEWDKYLKKLNL